jgi:diguanylate cyclase (GGDEF)-like protein/PAS domain S-box-containing protein
MSISNEQTVLDVRAINAQLLIAGLREQALAERLQRQLAVTSAITNSLDNGLYALDRTGRFTMVNPAAERMLGWAEGELLGLDAHAVIHGRASSDQPPDADSPLQTVLHMGTVVRDDHAHWTHRNGTVFPAAYSAAPIITDGQIIGAVVDFRNMSVAQQVAQIMAQQAAELARSRVRLEQLLADVQALALRDELTGLYNRRGFLTLAAQQMKVARRTKNALSLVFIDLDGFKAINDRWGHAMGNQALITLAHILTTTFRDSDLVARLGGDEFVVLATDSDGQNSANAVQRVQAECMRLNREAAAPYQLAMSVGVAHATATQRYTLEELLAQADALMYADKHAK